MTATAAQISRKLLDSLDDLKSLPAMPATAQKLLALSLDTDEGEAQLLALIAQDPQISAKLLSLANSPALGLTRKAASVPEAAILLGLTHVKAVSLGIAAMSNFTGLSDSRHFSPQDLWLHSLSIAMAMNTIAQSMPRNLRPKQDQIYLAGLLHDMGYMAIHFLDSEASNALHCQLAQQPHRQGLDVEFEVLGVSHCLIGAQLARQWHLPEQIVEVLGCHHAPYIAEAAADNYLVRLTSVAEKLLTNFGINEYCGVQVTDQEWLELGIDPSEAEELSLAVNEVALQVAQSSNLF
ncbi:MAG: HDOD domain-containing protein [Gallionella sp.]|nr:HDOD domain-containing protein [Gallionella sp.]MDD4945674.1 HDOD domain-containing protein [Gallionella sp.]MDD5611636.1 HDOD domain-containing protein [Gallionella sp.]